MTTVTWTQDANSNYEISSAEHLKQLMHKGALYTDAGSFPTDYWATGTNYIQTAHIDLLSDSTDITPIGNTSIFYGDYDGGEFRISNWSYVDPNFNTTDECLPNVGLFGNTRENVLKNIRLDGLWTLQGFSAFAGFLVGRAYEGDGNTQRGIWNVECYFSEGSLIDTNVPSGNSSYFGTVIGNFDGPIVSFITLKGSVNYLQNTHSARYVGGVAGRLTVHQSSSMIRNLATFPSGINGLTVGGIVGYTTLSASVQPTKYLNAMFGDLNGTTIAGGLLGYVNGTAFTPTNISIMICSMMGNINGGCAGGIIGYTQNQNGVTNSFFMNYMTGDISCVFNAFRYADQVGGLIGNDTNPDPILNSSIVAMNGNVPSVCVGVNSSSSTSYTITRNVDFGLTYTTDSYGITTAPTGVLFTANFPELPYVSIDDTDIDGKTHDFDFVYANLSGSSNVAYSQYTHAVLHKGDISTPFDVDFDVSEDNTTLYTTFANSTTGTFSQPLLGVYTPPLALQPRSINILVVVTEITGAVGYNITYEGPTGGEMLAFSGSTDLTYNIVGVEPSTQYTVKLYADTGTGPELVEELGTTTLTNVAANYNITEFQENGVTDLTSLDAAVLSNMSSVITRLVSTGDIVSVSLPSNAELATSFVDMGETLSIVGVNGVLLPFDDSSGAGQTVSLTLSDNITTVPITYDEVDNTISVESTTYSAGDSFALDGNEVEVFDFFGLTILGIDEILPLTIELRSTNIPVVIAEVTGAIAYNVTIEGPTGGEITALSGVTTLEHNISGVEPDTEYTIRLYVDTGSGYELSSELVTTTLVNVATSYDKEDYNDGGFYNLHSLPSSALSAISSVWNGVFETGDVVGVPVPRKSDFKGSFVNLGDTLSIKEINGVVLPFETTSGLGQEVNVILSDDTTMVPITYDDGVNNITVNGVVYYPGDIFILDGKKVAVLDVQ